MRARLLRTLGATTACLLLASAAACSSDEDDQPDVRPAPEALEEAVDSFDHGNTGRFTFQVGDDSEALIRTTGSFALIESHHAWQMTLSHGKRSVVTDQHRLEDRAWLRVSRDGAPPRGCWEPVSARAADARTGTPYEPVSTASGGRHPVLPQAAVVTTAEATDWATDGEGSVVEATTDLYSLAATLGEVVGDLELSPDSLDARGDVSILLDGSGSVVAWRTDVVAVLESLADAGVTLTDDMEALVETGAEIPVMTGFSDLGNGVELVAPDRSEVCGGTNTASSPEVSGGTRHTDEELVAALPETPDELHGLAVFESCTDFDAPGQCLGQEEGSVLHNLTDGRNQGLLLTVVRDHTPEELTERGAVCPDGPIDEPPRELGSGGEIPGRQGTGKRTDWEHEGWSGWVCDAEYSQVDSDGETQDDYSLRLLLAHDGEHLLSLQTASDVDVTQWAEEYVDRLND